MQWIFTSNNKLIQERFSVQKSLSMASWIMFPNKRKKGTSHWSPDFSSTEELCALNSGQPRSQSSLYPSIRTARREPWGRDWVLDSGFRTPNAGSWIMSADPRFQNPIVIGTWDSRFLQQYAGFLKQKFSAFQCLDSLWGWVLRFSGFDYWLRLSVTMLL